jgi:hypothetical protein
MYLASAQVCTSGPPPQSMCHPPRNPRRSQGYRVEPVLSLVSLYIYITRVYTARTWRYNIYTYSIVLYAYILAHLTRGRCEFPKGVLGEVFVCVYYNVAKSENCVFKTIHSEWYLIPCPDELDRRKNVLSQRFKTCRDAARTPGGTCHGPGQLRFFGSVAIPSDRQKPRKGGRRSKWRE